MKRCPYASSIARHSYASPARPSPSGEQKGKTRAEEEDDEERGAASAWDEEEEEEDGGAADGRSESQLVVLEQRESASSPLLRPTRTPLLW